jgi:hypothetical protein
MNKFYQVFMVKIVLFVIVVLSFSFSANINDQWFPPSADFSVTTTISMIYLASDGFIFMTKDKFGTLDCGDAVPGSNPRTNYTRFVLQLPTSYPNASYNALIASLLLAFQNGNKIVLHLPTQNNSDYWITVDRVRIIPL